MPKQIPLIEKREWLRAYEEGKSVASIAKEAHRDIKTVKRGIEDARRERDGQTARSELVKNALRKHQDQLLAVIDDIVNALKLPALDCGVDLPISLPGVTVLYDSAKGLTLMLDAENTRQWELLSEHMGRRDPLWSALDRWRSVMVRHMQARRELKSNTEAILEAKTGCKLVNKPVTPPFLYSYTVAPLLYQETLHRALLTQSPELGDRILVDTERGEVKYGGATTLAKAPGTEEECRANILDAFEELQKSKALKAAVETYGQLQDAIAKAKRLAEDISLLGLIPGQCRVCRRLGV